MALIKINTRSIPDDAVTPDKVSQNLGRRNLVINGDMQVAQRGTSQTAPDGDNFLVDRMKFKVTNSGGWTQSQDTDVPAGQGFNYSWKADCTSADAFPASNTQLRFIYTPEAQDMTHLMYGTANAKTTTLTFWVKSSKTGTYTLTAEAVHTAGRYYQTTYSVSTADTWEKKTITITGDTDTGEDWNDDNSGFFALSWWMGVGSSINGSGVSQDAWVNDSDYSELVGGQTINLADSTSNNFYITGVQLEVGDTATPFEHRSYGEELALCQRYYTQMGAGTSRLVGYGFAWNSTEVNVEAHLPQVLRASPTVTFSNNSNDFSFSPYNCDFATFTAAQFWSSEIGNRINLYKSGGLSTSLTQGQSGYVRMMNSTAKIAFDAEL